MTAEVDIDDFEMPDPLVFTQAAALKVKELIDDEGNPDLMLRVFVSGGGCSGFQYGFTFDETLQEGDTEVIKEGVKLLIDPMRAAFRIAVQAIAIHHEGGNTVRNKFPLENSVILRAGGVAGLTIK